MLSEHSPRTDPPGPGIILYDFFARWGGAEKLTQSLLKRYVNADLCVGFGEPTALSNIYSDSRLVITLSARSPVPFLTVLLLILRFKKYAPQLQKYRWAIFSGTFAPLSANRSDKEKNILYCHQLPRFCFDLRDHYMQKLPALMRPIFLLFVQLIKREYSKSLQSMRLIIANSKHTQSELALHFNQPSEVIYPPVDVKRFEWLGTKPYFLSNARLEEFKRVDYIIAAFKEMPDKNLVITSGGAEKDKLVALADGARNISFTDWVCEEELIKLTGFCKAVIYVPSDEPFGITPVEAMAAGKPVIGVASGGLLETVADGETGVLISGTPTVAKIREAVCRVTEMEEATLIKACQARASLFSEEIFLEKMAKAILND